MNERVPATACYSSAVCVLTSRYCFEKYRPSFSDVGRRPGVEPSSAPQAMAGACLGRARP